MSAVVQIPKTAVILPSNMKIVASNPLVIQKIKRRVTRFKMSKKQRDRIRAAGRRVKIPILTAISVGPAILLSAQGAMTATGLINQASLFMRLMLRSYTGIWVTEDGSAQFQPKFALIGLGPLFGVMIGKRMFRGTLTSINRALSRAQIPASAS